MPNTEESKDERTQSETTRASSNVTVSRESVGKKEEKGKGMSCLNCILVVLVLIIVSLVAAGAMYFAYLQYMDTQSNEPIIIKEPEDPVITEPEEPIDVSELTGEEACESK